MAKSIISSKGRVITNEMVFNYYVLKKFSDNIKRRLPKDDIIEQAKAGVPTVDIARQYSVGPKTRYGYSNATIIAVNEIINENLTLEQLAERSSIIKKATRKRAYDAGLAKLTSEELSRNSKGERHREYRGLKLFKSTIEPGLAANLYITRDEKDYLTVDEIIAITGMTNPSAFHNRAIPYARMFGLISDSEFEQEKKLRLRGGVNISALEDRVIDLLNDPLFRYNDSKHKYKPDCSAIKEQLAVDGYDISYNTVYGAVQRMIKRFPDKIKLEVKK